MMDSNVVKPIAKIIRPLLVELASAVNLPTGILGIAFPGVEISDHYPVFAEFVGPEKFAEKTDKDIKKEENIRIIHYTLSRYHPIIKCLIESGEKEVFLSREDAKTSSGDPSEGADVWNPLVKMLRSESEVPKSIKVFRYWLTDFRKSTLYYIPRSQDENIDAWNELSRISFLAGQSIRTCIIMLYCSEEIRREDADPFLNSLPDMLPQHEKKLLELVHAREVYQKVAKDLELRVLFRPTENSLVIEAKRFGAQKYELMSFTPPVKGDIKQIDLNWIKGTTNPKSHKLITGILTIRKALASHQGKGVLADVPWFVIWKFVKPSEDLNPDLSKNYDYNPINNQLPNEFFESNGNPIGSIEGYSDASLLLKKNIDLINKRVDRAKKWMIEEIDIEHKDLELISRIRSNGQFSYKIIPTVTLDNSALEALQSKSNKNWLRYLIKQVFDEVEESS